MEAILTIRDENTRGDVLNEWQLTFDKVTVSALDIIEQRVFTEVDSYNKRADEYRGSLVQPTSDEALLNKKSLKDRKLVNPEKQLKLAIDAFQNNQFFMLVDDQQIESLKETVTIEENTVVSFLKLVPLVGG